MKADSRAEKSFYTARLRAVAGKNGYPYLYLALYSLVPVFTDEIPTCATDKWWRVYINPSFFSRLTEDEGAAILIHEIWHPLGLDWERAEAIGVRDGEEFLWNIARDYEINARGELLQRLPRFTSQRPDGSHVVGEPISAKVLNLPEGLFAEQVFKILKERCQPTPPPDGGLPAPGSGNCGSCAHGKPQPWELLGPGNGNVPGQSEARTRIIRMATAKAISEAGASAGNVPVGWRRWATSVLQPRVSWRSELRSLVRGTVARVSGGTVPTFRKLGRREMSDPRLPAPARLRVVPRVALIIDTSGSMSDEYLSQATAETDGVLRSLGNGVAVTVHFTDAAAYAAQSVVSARQLIPYGGGGTDMTLGFQAVRERARHHPEEAPSLVVCITDGLTPWGNAKPVNARVLVVLLGKEGNGPPWGVPPDVRTLRITDI